MEDKGWIYSLEDSAWHLLNRCGLVVRRIPDQFLADFGAAQVNRYGARHGWPELVPGAPWIVCVLEGGPMDGRHSFISPAEPGGLPQRVAVEHEGQTLVYRLAGPGRGQAHRFVLAACSPRC